MAEKDVGYKKAYKMTGTPGYAGGPDQKVENGASGSHRDENWKVGAKQAKVAKSPKVGPYSNVKDQFGSKY